MKMSLMVIKLQSRNYFHMKKDQKGPNSANTGNIDVVVVLILCASSGRGLYLYHVS